MGVVGTGFARLSPAYIGWITNNIQLSYRDIEMLTQTELKKILHYDPETGDFTWLIKVAAGIKIGRVAGGVGTFPGGKKYRRISINNKHYRAHRLAYLYMTGEFPTGQNDHGDGDGTNNVWDNLRDVDQFENSKNRRLQSNNTSEFTGVGWDKEALKWRARIGVNGKRKLLGRFKEKKDAIAARKAANVLYGFHKNHGQQRAL